MAKAKTKEETMETGVENPIQEVKQPNYQWAADAEFKLSGVEYEFLYKTFATYIQQPKTQEVLAFLQGFEVLKKMLDDGIESGIVSDINK